MNPATPHITAIDGSALHTEILNPQQHVPAIIFCHGFTGSGFGPFSNPIANQVSEKYLVCRFDFRGQGASEGDFFHSSITRELEDLDTIVRYVRTTYLPSKLLLLGHSFGAAIALLYAQHHTVDGIISISGEGDLKKGIDIEFNEEQLAELERNGKTSIVNWSKDGDLEDIGRQFLDDMRAYSTLQAAEQLSSPILLIHGTKDDVVAYERTQEIYDLITAPKELHLIEGADHSFGAFSERLQISEVLEYIDDWLKRITQ